MKKLVITAVLIIAASAAVWASGNLEANEDGVVELEPQQLARDSYLSQLESVELKGVVKFESPVPELVSGGKDYTLTAPGMMMFAGYLEEGQRLTVKGYLVDQEQQPAFPNGKPGMPGGRGPGMFSNGTAAIEGNSVVLVESVIIDGVEYRLPQGAPDEFGRRAAPGQRMGGGASGGRTAQGRGGAGYRTSNGTCPLWN